MNNHYCPVEIFNMWEKSNNPNIIGRKVTVFELNLMARILKTCTISEWKGRDNARRTAWFSRTSLLSNYVSIGPTFGYAIFPLQSFSQLSSTCRVRAGHLQNSTDPRRQFFHENAHFTGLLGHRIQEPGIRLSQPVETIKLLTGQ